MDDEQGTLLSLQSDQRYRQAFAHLQAGEWDEAIATFEQLQADYPEESSLEHIIEEARLKASIDGTTHIRAHRLQISWRTVLFRVLAGATIVAVLAAAVWLIANGVVPVLEAARVERYHAQLLTQGRAYLAAEDLDQAETAFTTLLAEVPDSAEAQQGLTDIAALRKVQALYQQAQSAQESGDYATALQALTEISVTSPGYRDVNSRIDTVTRLQKIDTLFADAEQAFSTGDDQLALTNYLGLRSLSATYEESTIDERLFTIYMRMGRALVEARPPEPDQVSVALEYFTQALALKPRDASAIQEQRLADQFIKGQTSYENGDWHNATLRLRSVYDSAPDYLGTIVIDMLYDAYIRSGDLYKEENDIYRAYDDYANAARLPVADATLAQGRVNELLPLITPSPTVEPTATPQPTSTRSSSSSGVTIARTATPQPTATPTGLAAYRDRIVFFSSNPGQTGLWVMDSDGSDRQYVGNSATLLQQYDELQQQYQLSPDKRYLVFVKGTQSDAQLYLALPSGNTYGSQTRQLTSSTSPGANYDPAWSPDGTYIAYVSQNKGSDDIWTMTPDAAIMNDLTSNSFYDKHPTWSPDSDSIAFWSNRAGPKQIFVIDADGKNAHNISNSPWDEYDPLWIR